MHLNWFELMCNTQCAHFAHTFTFLRSIDFHRKSIIRFLTLNRECQFEFHKRISFLAFYDFSLNLLRAYNGNVWWEKFLFFKWISFLSHLLDQFGGWFYYLIVSCVRSSAEVKQRKEKLNQWNICGARIFLCFFYEHDNWMLFVEFLLSLMAEFVKFFIVLMLTADWVNVARLKHLFVH